MNVSGPLERYRYPTRLKKPDNAATVTSAATSASFNEADSTSSAVIVVSGDGISSSGSSAANVGSGDNSASSGSSAVNVGSGDGSASSGSSAANGGNAADSAKPAEAAQSMR